MGDHPTSCPKCGKSVVYFHKQPQGKNYYGMRCTGEPRHCCNFGVHQVGDTLYYKGASSWHQWVGKYEEDDAPAAEAPAPVKTEMTAAQAAYSEHEKIDAEIARLWNAKQRRFSLDASIRTRFKKGLNELTIIQKREVLAGLEKEK